MSGLQGVKFVVDLEVKGSQVCDVGVVSVEGIWAESGARMNPSTARRKSRRGNCMQVENYYTGRLIGTNVNGG